jgi:4-amino-4-deoxy-L-arabinose transferase-like glycosyltransferase
MTTNQNMHAAGAPSRASRSGLKWLRGQILAVHPRAIDMLGWVALASVSVPLLLVGLGDYGIVNGNEALYIESAREMLLSGNLAIPTLNGLPYLEKPPLFVWLIAVLTQAFGTDEFGARIVSPVAALALVFAACGFSRLLGIGKTGVAAGFILITSLGVDVMSRVAMPDLLLTALFASACFSFLTALRAGSVGYLRLCAALLAAATLVKGLLPVVLFAAIAIAFFWFQPARRRGMLGLGRDPWSMVILIMPLTLWLLAIELRQPGAAYHFIVNEHILRFIGLREPHDYYSGSAFYYVPRLFLFFFPWVGALAFGWHASVRNRDSSRRELRRFLWLCIWVPFCFFSLSSAKANYYILVCLPAMALLTADYLPELIAERRRFNLALAVIVPVMVLVTLWMFRIWAVRSGRTEPFVQARDGSVSLTIAVILVLTLIVVAVLQAGWRRGAILCIGGLILPLSFEFDHLVSRAEPIMSARTMASYIQARHPEMPVFLYQDYEAVGALPIYLGRTLPVIDSKSNDLYYGHRVLSRHPSFITEDQALAAGPGALIVVMSDREKAFSATDLRSRTRPVTTIGRVRLYQIAATE